MQTMTVRGKSRKSNSRPLSLAAAGKALLEVRRLAKLAKARVRELRDQLKQARKEQKRARKRLKVAGRAVKAASAAAKLSRRRSAAKQKAVVRPRKTAAAVRPIAANLMAGRGMEVLRPIPAATNPTAIPTIETKIAATG
jgi:hypothetical protein